MVAVWYYLLPYPLVFIACVHQIYCLLLERLHPRNLIRMTNANAVLLSQIFGRLTFLEIRTLMFYLFKRFIKCSLLKLNPVSIAVICVSICLVLSARSLSHFISHLVLYHLLYWRLCWRKAFRRDTVNRPPSSALECGVKKGNNNRNYVQVLAWIAGVQLHCYCDHSGARFCLFIVFSKENARFCNKNQTKCKSLSRSARQKRMWYGHDDMHMLLFR